MRFTQVDKEAWVENCVECHVAMRPVDPEGEQIYGLVESFPIAVIQSERAKINFDNWVANPVIQGTPLHWYCESCKTVWGAVFGAWTKSTWQGEVTPLPPTYISPSGVERVINYNPQFEGASMCPHCHTWRHVINTEVRGIGADQTITRTHFCIECKATQDITSPSPEKQVNEFIKENMTTEGLVGDRNPAKLM
jgi:hypothetical protein